MRHLSTPPKRIKAPLHLPDTLRIHRAHDNPLRIRMKKLATPHLLQILECDNLLGSAKYHHARAVLVAHAGARVRCEHHQGLDALDVEAQTGLVANLKQPSGRVRGLEADACDADVLDVFVVLSVCIAGVDSGAVEELVLGDAIIVDLDVGEVGVVDLAHGAELGDRVENHGCGGAGGHVADVDGAIAVVG